MSDEWNRAQQWEADWWKTSTAQYANTHDEERKQLIYAPCMGLEPDWLGRIDLKGASVLDVGGGPVSLLLKCHNGGRRVVVDPLARQWPEWVRARYESSGIRWIPLAGEDIPTADEAPELSDYDEVWLYNCLQHTRDPELIIRNIRRVARCLRIFEWTRTPKSDGHIHSLTKEELEKWIGQPGREIEIRSTDGRPNFAFAGVYSLAPELGSSPDIPRELRRALTFHLPGLPHTQTNKSYLSCAYTQKVWKLASMLTKLGHTVYHYGCEGSDPDCTENVVVCSNAQRLAFYPENEDRTQQYRYDIRDAFTRGVFNPNVEREIRKRLAGGNDFFLASWGWGHQPVAEALGSAVTVVEPGIGYPDTFARYRVFESYYWQAWVYGKGSMNGGQTRAEPAYNGSWYDAVIPNFFDPDDFDYNPTPLHEREGYLLYVGRLVYRKGVQLCAEIARATGRKLIIAGQGTLTDEGMDVKRDSVEFVGYADLQKRRKLMAGATCLLAPTYYLEPFGGVAVEAMMSGTPVITTDWGAFSETVLHGITGFRCHVFAEFVKAVGQVEQLSPATCRQWALSNFSCGRVGKMYDHYFQLLRDHRGTGPQADWYSPDSEVSLEWLNREYPPNASSI